MTVDVLSNYAYFVNELLSEPSKNLDTLISRLKELDKTGVNIASLLTGSIGMSAESGELVELIKKQLFQGKPLDQQAVVHMKRELGDILFYWFVACRALNLQAEDVITANIAKLEARYPGGNFEIGKSEIRKVNDT